MEKIASPISTARPASTNTAARLSLAASVTTLLLLAMLHFLSPELNPVWRMVSEYALGSYGWALTLMFLIWALSCVSLFFAIRSQISTTGGKIGLGLLLLSASGMVMAAFFDINHSLHGLATLIGNLPFVIASILITVSLLRNQSWVPSRRMLLWLAHLPWVSVVIMVAVMFLGPSQSGAEFSSGAPIGLPNRLVVVAYCVWLIASAQRAAPVERL